MLNAHVKTFLPLVPGTTDDGGWITWEDNKPSLEMQAVTKLDLHFLYI